MISSTSPGHRDGLTGRGLSSRSGGGSAANRVLGRVLHVLELLAALAFFSLILLDANLPELLGGAKGSSPADSPNLPATRCSPRPAANVGGNSARATNSDGVIGQPFLQDVRETEITVGVLCSRPIRPVIGYGTSVAVHSPFTNSVRASRPRPVPGTDLWISEARITGLLADTVYYYRIKEPILTPAGMFRTARSAGEWFRFIVSGDSASAVDSRVRMCEAITRTQPTPQFILHTGSYAASDWRAEFFSPAAEILAKIPLIPTVYADASQRMFSRLAANPYYVVPLGAGRLLCLDTRDEQTFAPGSSQYAWISQQLARPKKAWTFIALRRSPYSLARSDEAVRRHLVPLFEQHGVDAVFCGGRVGYQRAEWGGVLYFSIALSSPPEASARRIPGWHRTADLANRKVERAPCYLRVDANNQYITFSAFDVRSGEVIEQLRRLRKKDGASRFDPAVRLGKWLRSADVSRRRWAAAWLMDRNEAVKPRALRRLASDRDPYVKVMAIRALARRPDVHAFGTVLSKLTDSDQRLCWPDALAFFARHRHGGFAKNSTDIGRRILDAGPDGGLANPRASSRLLTALAAALANHRNDANDALLAEMWSNPEIQDEVRTEALRHWLAGPGLGRHGEWLSLPADPAAPSALRTMAVDAVGRLGNLRSLSLLIAWSLRSDLPAEVVSAARVAIADFQPLGGVAELIAMLQLTEQHLSVAPAEMRSRILDTLRRQGNSPMRALAAGAVERLAPGQLVRYLHLHRLLTDAARWVAICFAVWLILSRLSGLPQPSSFLAISRWAPVRSLNVVIALGCVIAALAWWYSGTWLWAWIAYPAVAVGLALLRRRLNRTWPRLDPTEWPERSEQHEQSRCRVYCSLTIVAAVAMMVLALAVGY